MRNTIIKAIVIIKDSIKGIQENIEYLGKAHEDLGFAYWALSEL